MKHLFELSQPSELASVLDALASAVSKGTESKELADEMRLIAEEALTNVLKYRLPGERVGWRKGHVVGGH